MNFVGKFARLNLCKVNLPITLQRTMFNCIVGSSIYCYNTHWGIVMHRFLPAIKEIYKKII